VFFFIDPEILNDPSMDHVHEITLSYTFFKTDEDNQVRRPPSYHDVHWDGGSECHVGCVFGRSGCPVVVR
jgi:hypothetical protein